MPRGGGEQFKVVGIMQLPEFGFFPKASMWPAVGDRNVNSGIVATLGGQATDLEGAGVGEWGGCCLVKTTRALARVGSRLVYRAVVEERGS